MSEWDEEATRRIDEYWHTSPLESEFRMAVMNDLAYYLMPGDVLDVGCGSGVIYSLMRGSDLLKDRKYVGVDASTAMLALARMRFPNTEFLEMDVHNLTMQADNVLCIQVLQHLPDYHEAVRRLCRAARKVLYITCWLGGADIIQQTEDKVAGKLFYNNVYSHAGIVDFIEDTLAAQSAIEHTTRPVVKVKHIMGNAHSIAVIKTGGAQ